MGLLSALGKRGMQALEAGDMFGGRIMGNGGMANTDRALAQVFRQNPGATDQQIAEAVFGQAVRAGTIRPQDAITLVNTYRTRALRYAPDDLAENMRYTERGA